MSGLPREVIKWIQSLDLTWQVKTPKWDMTNGYLLAEIFSWYFPQEIHMHSYNNGTSLDSKVRNWSLLRNFISRHKLDIPEEFLEGTIHCKEGAAALLIERVYEILTNRGIRKLPPEHEIDFTDRAYQVKLPYHARSTASQAVKNNLRITELMADKNLILGQQKAQHIVNLHIDHRQLERIEDPGRFDKQPTIGELAVRHAPPTAPKVTASDSNLEADDIKDTEQCGGGDSRKCSRAPSREPTVQFKEVTVKQLSGGSADQFRTAVPSQ